LFKEQPNTISESTRKGMKYGCGIPIKESQLMSKEVLNIGSDLSKLEENQLMTHTTCPLWKGEGTHFQSARTSSNTTKVGEPDFTGKCR
jgi:hypothetical protein